MLDVMGGENIPYLPSIERGPDGEVFAFADGKADNE